MSKLKIQTYNLNLKTDLKYRSYHYSLEVIQFINSLPNKRLYWTVGDQLLRSATSIGANIIEAKSSSSKREFIRYYEISLKSANESKYWLSLLRDSNLDNLDLQVIIQLLNETTELANMLGASLLTLKGKKMF